MRSTRTVRDSCSMVADIFFRDGHLDEGKRIHCLLSRAFVQDRELYRSAGLKSANSRANFTDNGWEEPLDVELEKPVQEDLEHWDEETALMVSMGLPVEFRSSSSQRSKVKSKSYFKETKSKNYWGTEPDNEKDQSHLPGEGGAAESHLPGEGGADESLVSDVVIETSELLEEGAKVPEFSADWEEYWSCQGEELLWSEWLKKHPEDGAILEVAPWDCPEQQEEWIQHFSETYYYYWDQFHYWASKGWTVNQASCDGVECNTQEGGQEVRLEPTSCCQSDQQNQSVEAEVTDLMECLGLQSENMGQSEGSHVGALCFSGDEPRDGGTRKGAGSRGEAAFPGECAITGLMTACGSCMDGTGPGFTLNISSHSGDWGRDVPI